MTVCFSVCCFFSPVRLTLFGIICGTMSGAFGGINEEAIHPLQSGFSLLWGRELTIRHQSAMDESVIQNRR
jgi:hypothetical protein